MTYKQRAGLLRAVALAGDGTGTRWVQLLKMGISLTISMRTLESHLDLNKKAFLCSLVFTNKLSPYEESIITTADYRQPLTRLSC